MQSGIGKMKKNYLHLRGTCMTAYNAGNEYKHITIANQHLMELDEERAIILEEAGFLAYIIANNM